MYKTLIIKKGDSYGKMVFIGLQGCNANASIKRCKYITFPVVPVESFCAVGENPLVLTRAKLTLWSMLTQTSPIPGMGERWSYEVNFFTYCEVL